MMQIEAIVYTSNTGFTKAYAELLAKECGLPLFSLAEAKQSLAAGSTILYLGWLRIQKVKGYKQARKRYRIAALCGVGDIASGSKVEEFRQAGKLPPELPFFTLQGGLDLQRLKGVDKMLMKLMIGKMRKELEENPQRSPEDEAMLDLLINGGSRVSLENLDNVLAWYHENAQ